MSTSPKPVSDKSWRNMKRHRAKPTFHSRPCYSIDRQARIHAQQASTQRARLKTQANHHPNQQVDKSNAPQDLQGGGSFPWIDPLRSGQFRHYALAGNEYTNQNATVFVARCTTPWAIQRLFAFMHRNVQMDNEQTQSASTGGIRTLMHVQ